MSPWVAIVLVFGTLAWLELGRLVVRWGRLARLHRTVALARERAHAARSEAHRSPAWRRLRDDVPGSRIFAVLVPLAAVWLVGVQVAFAAGFPEIGQALTAGGLICVAPILALVFAADAETRWGTTHD